MLRSQAATAIWVACAAIASTSLVRADEEKAEVLREDYEASKPTWHREQTDATVRLIAHDRSPLAAHKGRTSEHFAFEAGPGSTFLFSHKLPRIPITEALHASLYVRANHAGIQVFARVVLPKDVAAESGEPSFVMVPGTIFDRVDRWQRLELVQLPLSVERQARVLRASTRRPVSVEGAYLDQIVVNLYGGTGRTEVFLDDLEIAPVPASALAAASQPALPAASQPPLPATSPPASEGPSSGDAPRSESYGPPKVTLERNRLKKNGRDWFPLIVDAPGANIGKLGMAGFDVLSEDAGADPKRLQEAVERGFLLMPDLGAKAVGNALSADQAKTLASSFSYKEWVAFWNLGSHLGRAREINARRAELDRVRETVSGFWNLNAGFSRLTTGTVDDGLNHYSKPPTNLNLIGIRPRVWATCDEPIETYNFLSQRRALTALNNAGGFFWAWIPARPHPVVQTAIWGHDAPPAWGYPQILPEQLRLYAYVALTAGYRGLAFEGDAELTRDAGEPLLIEMALLNEEIKLLESILANSTDPIAFYMTNLPDPQPFIPMGGALGRRVMTTKELPPHPTVRAAAIGTLGLKGSLLLVTDMASGAQYQPPQMAEAKLNVTVPAPEGAQAWEISPGDVRYLKDRARVPGGTQFTIPEFCGTSIVLVTTDWSLKDRLELAIRRNRPTAVSKAIDQAQRQWNLVNEINGRILADGHRLYDPDDPLAKLAPGAPVPNDEVELLQKAAENIKAAREAQEREDYAVAWAEARRAGRPLRILMNAHWTKAMVAMFKAVSPQEKDPDEPLSRALIEDRRKNGERKKKKKPPVLIKPVSSPPLVCFNTLPQHYLWVDWMKNGRFGGNLVPTGSFDDPEALEPAGWVVEGHPVEGITSKVSVVPNSKDKSKQILKLTVEPTDKAGLDRLPPFLDVPAAAIRSPGVKVATGQFIRVTLYVQRALMTASGAGGIIIRDSIGGEPLQFRIPEPLAELSKVVIFRRAPEDGTFSVLLGLAGYGAAYFDDFKVEVVEAPPTESPGNMAEPSPRPRSAPPAASTASRLRFRDRRSN